MKKNKIEYLPEHILLGEISVEEQEEEQSPSFIKKMIMGLLGVVVLVLIISLSFQPAYHILEGWIESDPLADNRIELEEFTIVFDEATLAALQQLYYAEQKVEFSVCLSGTKKGKEYFIDSLKQPRMIEQTFNHVVFEPCSAETLLMLHTHPYKSCIASQTDLKTLAETKKWNSDVVMVVMCEPARFSVYS